MMRRSYSAIVERNVEWEGPFSTEPYEVGWASEAVFFIRSLGQSDAQGQGRVQITPDGMHWCDEGTTITLPSEQDEVTFCKVTGFGNWLRIVGDAESPVIVLVTLALKE